MTVTQTDPLAEAMRHKAIDAQSQATAIEQARAIAEVQAAVVVAQQCPRDLQRAESEMRSACSRMALAQRAFYRVPNRGNGPSVHLARELARVWGNVQYGVWETRRDDTNGVSEIQAWAWDVQTNTRSSRSFVVPHQRMVKGERKALVDLGDVYLNNQNVGARAVRECIFTVLPTWFAETAQEVCQETLQKGDGVPLSTRIENMLGFYRERYGLGQAQLEARVGKRRGQWDDGDVAQLTIVFQSLERGEMRVEDEFESDKPSTSDFATPAAADVDTATETTADPMTAKTRGHMFALFNELNIGEDDQRAGIAHIVGHPIESRGDLTETEAQQVVTRLKVKKAEKDAGAEPVEPGLFESEQA